MTKIEKDATELFDTEKNEQLLDVANEQVNDLTEKTDEQVNEQVNEEEIINEEVNEKIDENKNVKKGIFPTRGFDTYKQAVEWTKGKVFKNLGEADKIEFTNWLKKL